MFARNRKFYLYLWHIFFISVTLFLAWSYVNSHKGDNLREAEKTFEVRQSGFKFINPLLECEIEGEASLQKYVPFEKKVKSRIQEEIIDKNADTRLSLYFRNLNNGPSFGINERDNFSPASLLKVPVMIAYLKWSEVDPSVLSKTFMFEGVPENYSNAEETIKPEETLKIGEVYQTGELIKRMIVYSDNEAAYILLGNMPEDRLNQVYKDLGVTIPDIRQPDDFMTVKEYAAFFRILYNAAYLEKKTSEKALEILSSTRYQKGLSSSVSSNITISHKFGERFLEEDSVFPRQLHDCGIVYYRQYPYLLCVMTKGKQIDKLENIIEQVSKIIFEEISRDFPL